jgi:hypothetical protein
METRIISAQNNLQFAMGIANRESQRAGRQVLPDRFARGREGPSPGPLRAALPWSSLVATCRLSASQPRRTLVSRWVQRAHFITSGRRGGRVKGLDLREV